MEFDQGPDVDPEANPRHELARLRELAEEVNDLIKEFERLRRYLLDAQQAYHKVVYELPKDGGLRIAFTDEYDQFSQDRNIDGVTAGAKKRLSELKQMLKAIASNVRTLNNFIPDTHLEFESDDDDDGASHHSMTVPSGTTSSFFQPKAPSGAASSRHSATKTRPPTSSAEHAFSKVSDETHTSSAKANYGSAEPSADAFGKPDARSSTLHSTFRRAVRIEAPQDTSSGSPLKFNADGTDFGTTSRKPKKLYDEAVKTGADFSAYNGNPFYQNSSVTLPIKPTECVPAGTDKYPAPPPLVFKGITDAPFTGDIRSYPRWRDAFIRPVHAPGRVMQDSDRLLYLKQCLRGPPLELVDRYSIDDIGYQYATEALENRFFNPQQARFTLRKDLHDLRPPASSYSDILRFEQDLVHICGNFRQAGEDITENQWCFDIVMAKLPPSVRYALIQRKRDKRDNSPWTIRQLLDEVHESLDIMNEVYTYEGGSQQQPAGSKARNNRLLALEGPYTSSAERHGGPFVGAISDAPQNRACVFCSAKGSHWPTDCPVYPTVSERYERAKELNLCFVCLCKDHWRANATTCKVQGGLCPFCEKAFHHKALCPTFLEKRRAEGSEQQRRKKKKSSNRYQHGAGPTKDPKNGRPPYCAQHDGSFPVAPGEAEHHRADDGSAQARSHEGRAQTWSHEGRAQTYAAAAAGIEEAGATRMAERPSSKRDGVSGPPNASQQPAGSPQVAGSYGHEPAHLRHTNGQMARHTNDDGHYSVVTHESDAPTEPDEDELGPFDPSSFSGYAAVGSGYAAVGVAHASKARTHGTFLECGMVTVFNPITQKRKRFCAFFDCGSTGTFISTELARALKLPNLGSESLRLDTFAQDKPVRLDTFRTTLGFDQTDGSCLVLDLKASHRLVPPLEAIFIEPSDEALLKRNHCNLVPYAVVPDILIGKDKEHLFCKEYDPPLPSGFTLLHTTIGTILSGHGQFRQRSADLTCSPKGSADPTCPPGHHQVSAETPSFGSADPSVGRSTSEARAEATHLSVFFTRAHPTSPAAMAQRFWQTESIGTETASRVEEDVLREQVRKNICLAKDGDGYQICLPWKTKDGEPPFASDIPTHLGLAISHLGSFQKEHLHRPEVLHTYGNGLRQMEVGGAIEKFNPSDKTIRFLHFYTHHADFGNSTCAQMRATFDGSAKLEGTPSIDDYLHGSPFGLPTLVGILLRIRLHGFAVYANVAQSLRQLTLHTRDRSACAFIWFKDPTKPPHPDNLVFYRFKRVPLDLKPSGLMLEALTRFHLEHQGPLAEELWRNCHQDSVIFSADTLAEALEKYRQTQALLAK